MFNKFFDEFSLEYKMEVFDGKNRVLFATDNKQEIYAIKHYFECFWKMDYFVNTNRNEYISYIRSVLCHEYEEIINRIEFSFEEKLFYDLESGYKYEDENYYIVMRINKMGITVFDKNNRDIIYLRKSNIVENLHLSQLIKEPLHNEKVKNGYILLHSSLYTSVF